ncbi:MAG TPA: contractile injection system tape measure protein, partial [Cytophagaceae bacterium]|nr:contractile injection system tape measure protein [Cytophagaceae bacterium]
SSIEAGDKKNKQAEQKRILVYTTDQPIYIINAGLVLLYPFLMHLFSLCGLIENRKFKTNALAHKAVWLLQYIVDKEGKAEEHQLVLNKLLCGIPLSEPLSQAISITEEDKEICENLIKGVIENWSILKKTSNDNFRVSFLQRKGCITIEEMSFVLKVQERGFDVLMDKLPWSISLIKLPIMDKVMKVDWR